MKKDIQKKSTSHNAELELQEFKEKLEEEFNE